jgi:hypothetical protein
MDTPALPIIEFAHVAGVRPAYGSVEKSMSAKMPRCQECQGKKKAQEHDIAFLLGALGSLASWRFAFFRLRAIAACRFCPGMELRASPFANANFRFSRCDQMPHQKSSLSGSLAANIPRS